MRSNIKLIGIGDEGKASLLACYEKWIYESDLLIGGERQLEFFPDFKGEKITIKGNLQKMVSRLQQESKNVVILASGDPLFYGIGGYLSNKFSVEIYPYLSSIQLAFSKMNEAWHDAYISSLHGRSISGFAQRIDGKDKVAILTDKINTPSSIAKYLLSFDMTEYKAFVCENLGGVQENCGWYTLEELTDQTFSPLNVVILKRKAISQTWSIGIDDEEFFQRKPEKGLITKKEIRTLSISALNLKIDSIVWDIGTCTGSVAIEAAKVAKEGAVYAIEKNEHDLENFRQNIRKFRTDITVFHGKAPSHLNEFPAPDAVFIGGTAGGMEGILKICTDRLKENGRIVINAVTIENLVDAVEIFKRFNFDTEITLAQISRSKPILNLTRFNALNPIYIIQAKHKKGE